MISRIFAPRRARIAICVLLTMTGGSHLFVANESIAQADAEPALNMTVAVAVATIDSEKVVDDAWMDAQWAAVDRLYADIGIRFERRLTDPLPETSARLETKEDRDALGPRVKDGVINVFFVKSLLDIDEIGRIRMGVCWRAPANHRFVAVASNAKPTVLAHELGHFLGNGHSKVTDNIMSYDRTGGPVFFDAAQKKTMRTTALQLLRDGVVKPVSQRAAGAMSNGTAAPRDGGTTSNDAVAN